MGAADRLLPQGADAGRPAHNILGRWAAPRQAKRTTTCVGCRAPSLVRGGPLWLGYMAAEREGGGIAAVPRRQDPPLDHMEGPPDAPFPGLRDRDYLDGSRLQRLLVRIS